MEVYGDRPHGLADLPPLDPLRAGDRQRHPEVLAVVPGSLQLDEVVEEPAVLAGDGLQIELLSLETEPDWVRSAVGLEGSGEGDGSGVGVEVAHEAVRRGREAREVVGQLNHRQSLGAAADGAENVSEQATGLVSRL